MSPRVRGLSGVFGCVGGGVEVGEGDVVGDLFDVAAVSHETSSPGHQEPGLAGAGVGVVGLGEGQAAVVERDDLDAYAVWP